MLWPFLQSVHLNQDDDDAKDKEYMNGEDKWSVPLGKSNFLAPLNSKSYQPTNELENALWPYSTSNSSAL